jgi:putative FmdB family regulatory protein
MPLYDYECTSCGAEPDITHDIGKTVKKCPECGKQTLKRAWRKVAAFHARLSPMNPRAGRGAGNTGVRRKQ